MIEIKNVCVTFNKNTPLEKTVLKGLNLKIAPGDFITVIGSNGAGKSTLLGLLSGNIIATSGKIFFDNTAVTYQSVEKRSKWVGYVYQDPRIGTCDELTVEENLAFANNRGSVRGLKIAVNSNLRKKFKKILSELHTNLEHRLNERVALLSGGQRQVLSLVMATLHTPKILLLDEHTAALDPKNEKLIFNITKQIVAEYGLTTFMVTHNMHHALEMGNRTILMQQGKIIKDLRQKERTLLTPKELINFF